MSEAAGSRWRKAILISCILHSIVLAGVGYFAGKTVLPASPAETLIELELASEPPESAVLSTAAMPVNHEQPPAVSSAAPAVPVAASAPTVAVSDMALVAGAAGVAGGGAAGASSGEPAVGGAGGAGVGESAAAASREVIPPGILSRREPNYPEKARQAGIEGTVVLSIEILETGRAGEVNVYQSSGSELLDEAAVAAVQRWRFIPAKIRGTGQSIACQTTLPVVFKLKA